MSDVFVVNALLVSRLVTFLFTFQFLVLVLVLQKGALWARACLRFFTVFAFVRVLCRSFVAVFLHLSCPELCVVPLSSKYVHWKSIFSASIWSHVGVKMKKSKKPRTPKKPKKQKKQKSKKPKVIREVRGFCQGFVFFFCFVFVFCVFFYFFESPPPILPPHPPAPAYFTNPPNPF